MPNLYGTVLSDTCKWTLPLNAQIGNRIKAYTLAWYDYPKTDGPTKEVKAQNKNAEKANEYDVYPLLCLSVFYE